MLKKKPELATEPILALFAEHRAGIRAYSKADTAGSYKLTVNGDKVWIDFYAGDDARRSKRFILR